MPDPVWLCLQLHTDTAGDEMKAIDEILDCRYALPKDREPKRIGDMDRDELLQVIAELSKSVKWWTEAALNRKSEP